MAGLDELNETVGQRHFVGQLLNCCNSGCPSCFRSNYEARPGRHSFAPGRTSCLRRRVRILGDCTCLYVYDVPSRILAIQLSHVGTELAVPHAGRNTPKHWAGFAHTPCNVCRRLFDLHACVLCAVSRGVLVAGLKLRESTVQPVLNLVTKNNRGIAANGFAVQLNRLSFYPSSSPPRFISR